MMYKVLFSAWLSLGCMFSVTAETSLGDLTVLVDGFESDDGVLAIGLFTSRETYDVNQGWEEADSENAHRFVIAEVHDRQARHIFERLSYGEYAIKLYHDENNNRQLDKNFTGIPKEDYGFSNNPKGFLGSASYQEALFKFKVPEKTLIIHLRTF